jgi:signal transduction histidine kinase
VLSYSRPGDATMAHLDLGPWLHEFAAFVAVELKARSIHLTVDTVPNLWVRADANQLRQILLNLVRNAQEALEGRSGAIALAAQRDRGPGRSRNEDVAVLSVSDNGPGISPEIQARLFDPFFTTKPAGTGLGLSIVARLVENQGGDITFRSAPQVGTRFAVHLPIATPARQTVGT